MVDLCPTQSQADAIKNQDSRTTHRSGPIEAFGCQRSHACPGARARRLIVSSEGWSWITSTLLPGAAFHSSSGLVRIAGRYNPNLECAAAGGCRPGSLYPNEECFSHSPNMVRASGVRKLARGLGALVPFAPECRENHGSR